eukprot:COSAG06_NODE_26488_length_613_cov_3.869650_1_plen_87_part_00
MQIPRSFAKTGSGHSLLKEISHETCLLGPHQGLTLHNGGNPDGTEPDDAIDRRQRQFYRWENSQRVDLQIRSGEMGAGGKNAFFGR